MSKLNVNIDHVATLRNARGGSEPDVIEAALIAEKAGAYGIVCHLREDRRHIKDKDVLDLKNSISIGLDLEMAATEKIIDFAIKVKPKMVTIVPENRKELTTEGGLNVFRNFKKMEQLSAKMHDNGILVSFFIEPNIGQLNASKDAGADMVEIHTGNYANDFLLGKDELNDKHIKMISEIVESAKILKLKVAAGHGLNYKNTLNIAKIPSIDEFSIGHSIISHSVFTGLESAVKEMIQIINVKQE